MCVCGCVGVHITGRYMSSIVSLQQFEVKQGDIEILGKIGNGISGEVFRMKFKPTGAIMAAKVSTALILLLLNNLPTPGWK